MKKYYAKKYGKDVLAQNFVGKVYAAFVMSKNSEGEPLAATFVADFGRVMVEYDYSTEDNLVNHSDTVEISEQQFYDFISHIEEKWGMEIFVRLEFALPKEIEMFTL